MSMYCMYSNPRTVIVETKHIREKYFSLSWTLTLCYKTPSQFPTMWGDFWTCHLPLFFPYVWIVKIHADFFHFSLSSFLLCLLLHYYAFILVTCYAAQKHAITRKKRECPALQAKMSNQHNKECPSFREFLKKLQFIFIHKYSILIPP